jgi:two-component system phosphate regulon sensor histidine kinase PhoR
MFKNLSIHKLTLTLTGIIVLINGLLIGLFTYIHRHLNLPYSDLISIMALAILNFIIIRSLLERAVFRKIKIIYKVISGQKISKEDKKNLGTKNESIGDVSTDVMGWVKSKEDEITELKTLSDYRKAFVGNLSHELKTPLFSIQGYLHSLIEGAIYDENINIKYLDRAIKNVERLQNIIEDLDTINVLESKSKKYEMKNFDIIKLVSEVFQDLLKLAEERSIHFELVSTPGEEIIVYGNKEAIRQVLNNLIVNSIKYGEQNGITKLSFHKIEKSVLIEVSDNGNGIEEKHLKHLFDRFYRVDDNRSRKIGGSGLGLSIVKHIVEAHGGGLNVRSAVGLGSTFGFTLKGG